MVSVAYRSQTSCIRMQSYLKLRDATISHPFFVLCHSTFVVNSSSATIVVVFKYNNITIAIVYGIRVASRWFKSVVHVYTWYFLSPILKLRYTTINHGGQSKYNNKHHMKSNSGMIFVMIGDTRRSGRQSTKQHNNRLNHMQPVWPHLLDGFVWLWEGCH